VTAVTKYILTHWGVGAVTLKPNGIFNLYKMKEIKLSKHGKNKGKYVALVDDEDFEYVNQFSWSVTIKPNKITQSNIYAQSYIKINGDAKKVTLHRLIMKQFTSEFIDHVNGCGLDCRKSNLRICTNGQNMANKVSYNKTGYKGVHKIGNRYYSEITSNKKHYHLGFYDSINDAYNAYIEASKKYHGEFAKF